MRTRQFCRELPAVGNVGDHQARAFGGERARIVHADAFGASGQNSHAAVETRHNFPLCRERRSAPVAQLLPQCAAMNFAKASSCCLMKPMVCSSLIWPVLSSMRADTLPMKISGLFMVIASRKIMQRRRSYCMRPPPRTPAPADCIVTGLPAKGWLGTRDTQSMAFFKPPGIE